MKKILLITLFIVMAGGYLHGQNMIYYKPVANKETKKRTPRLKRNVSDIFKKSHAARIRADHREVRKAEIRAKNGAKVVSRERQKELRKQDKMAWGAYRQKHDKYGRVKVRNSNNS